MTYPSPPGPQPSGGWNDPAWSSGQPGGQPDPTQPMVGQPMSGQPVSGDPASGYPPPADPASGYPPMNPAGGYPPQLDPVSGYPVAPPMDPAGGYPPQLAAYQASGYPSYGYPPAAAPPPTNGMAIASMVISIVGILGLCGYGLGGYIGVLGAILGHVAKKQIRERGENGDGMALAGIILGWIATAIALIATVAIIVFIIWAANQDPSTFQ